MVKLLISLVVICIFAASKAEENCFENTNTYRCQLGSKTPYRFVANYNASQLSYPGCTEKKFWFLARHGTRYPKDKRGRSMKKSLKKLRDHVIKSFKTGQSKLTEETINKLNDWEFDFQNEDSMNLKPEGERELFGIGERMKSRFPSLLSTPYSKRTHRFKYTDTQRTKLSGESFVKGIFGEKQGNEVEFSKPEKHDPVLRFEDSCDRWSEEVHKNPNAKREKKLFANSEAFNKMENEVSQLLGINVNQDDLQNIYTMCSFETAWNENPSPWCDFLTLDQFKLFEYKDDLEYYYDDGYGYEINYAQACPLLVDMFSFFQSHKEKLVTGYFSHSPILLKFTALLGLSKDNEPLKHDKINESRKWIASRVDPFASNVAFVLYQCEDKEDGIVVLNQERVVEISGCPIGIPCPISTMKTLFPSNQQECNFDGICR